MNNKILIGKDIIDIDVNGVFDRVSNNNWYRATGKGLREIYSDGTIIINIEYANINDCIDVKYNMNNDSYIEKVDVVTTLI